MTIWQINYRNGRYMEISSEIGIFSAHPSMGPTSPVFSLAPWRVQVPQNSPTWSQKCGISLEYHWNPKTQSSQFYCAQTPRHYNSWTASGYANIQSALDLGHLGLLAMRNPSISWMIFMDIGFPYIADVFHWFPSTYPDFHIFFDGFPISFTRATRALLEALDPLGRCHRGRFRTAPHFWWSNHLGSPILVDFPMKILIPSGKWWVKSQNMSYTCSIPIHKPCLIHWLFID